jgi:hypothetical protein
MSEVCHPLFQGRKLAELFVRVIADIAEAAVLLLAYVLCHAR